MNNYYWLRKLLTTRLSLLASRLVFYCRPTLLCPSFKLRLSTLINEHDDDDDDDGDDDDEARSISRYF